jgi:alpha-amylase
MKKRFFLVASGVIMLATSLLSGCNKASSSSSSEAPVEKEGPFTILWNNYDGKLLERDINVKKGVTPTYNSKTPVKVDDASNYYVFKGWDKEVIPAEDDVAYTAVYDSYPLGEVIPAPDGYIDTLPSDTKDGNIFHAFCWTFNQIKEKLPDLYNAGFKSIQTSPVQQPKSSGSSWWAYYQPLSLSIADNSKLGTKAELQSLCEEADKYGISIIADIVFNHLANISDSEVESDGTPKVFPGVATYEPYIYEHRNDANNPTFHHNMGSYLTQYYPYGGLPDLNTANPYVQERCLDLLKECIDVGIDGFRFDAAKHIETPDDPQYASDFWPNTLGVAKTYYKSKTGKDLYAYGEILNGADGGRDITVYTKLMDVTDNSYGAYVYNNLSGNANCGIENNFKGTTNDKVVNWVESHDTFAESSTHYDDEYILRGYAMIASRKDSRSLYLSRTDANLTVGQVYDYIFEDPTLGAVNKFHNRFVGAEEKLYANTSVYVNQRYNNNQAGAVIVDLKRTGKIAVSLDKLGTGVYYDQVTGEQHIVRNGHLVLDMPESSIVVLTKSQNLPMPSIDISNRGGVFVGDLTVNIKVTNGNGKYYVNDNPTPVSFGTETNVSLGALVDANNEVTLRVAASNDQHSVERTYKYKKAKIIEGYFNVLNISQDRFDNYELYMWSWAKGASGHWSKNYTIQDGILLVDAKTLNLEGFIIAVFPKNYVISNPNAWDSNCLSQTTDISANILEQGYYDASDL